MRTSILTGLYLLAVLGITTPALAGALQSESSIRSAAEVFIAKRHPWRNTEHTIEVGRLDSRSRLARCGSAIEAFMPPRAQIRQRTTVGIRCGDQGGWTVYLPVTVNAFARALVATQPLPPGTVLQPAHVQTVKRNVSALGYGYLASLDADGGYRVTRSVSQGAVITPQMVESAVMIRRGQTVKIIARTGSVGVSMSGVAASEASLGGRISVKNVKSGRLVEGIVRSSETVEVTL